MNIIRQMRLTAHFSQHQVADYLGISKAEYVAYEKRNATELPLSVLEKMASLYHVEEYDILMGTAVAHPLCKTPAQEAELIPFFRLVRNYLLMRRLEDHAQRDDPRYQIAWGRFPKNNIIPFSEG